MGILNWLKNLLKRRQPNITYPDKHTCALCWSKINFIINFRCKYCGWHFCDKHRLPENHKCMGNPKRPKDLIQGAAESLRYI